MGPGTQHNDQNRESASQHVPPASPFPGPCVNPDGHAHLPRLRYHCAPRTRDTMPRRVPRTRQKVMGMVPALSADRGTRVGPVRTVRGGSSLCACTAWGIVTLGLDHLSLPGGGGGPEGGGALCCSSPQG